MRTILLLTVSNVFMTIAWYGHLKYKASPLWLAILVSWGIAFVEEVISLCVFCAFSVLYLKEPLRWNYLCGFGCIVAAVFFVFYHW